jgi:hypothetical protein
MTKRANNIIMMCLSLDVVKIGSTGAKDTMSTPSSPPSITLRVPAFWWYFVLYEYHPDGSLRRQTAANATTTHTGYTSREGWL